MVSTVLHINRKNWFSVLNELITGQNEDASRMKFLLPLKKWAIY